jgi:hypothetical protein
MTTNPNAPGLSPERLRALMPHVGDTERQIAARIVQDAVTHGWTVCVNDGGAWTVVRGDDAETILAAMGTTGSDTLRFLRGAREYGGWVTLIWGNGPDVISDYSARAITQAILAGAERLAEYLP